jgi:uncharacterized protein YdgA (DUF945 family)
MKKTLIAIVVLAGAGAAAAPYIIGSQAESIIREQAELTNQQLAMSMTGNPQLKDLSMKLESYEKGYLNAQAKAMFRVAVTIPGEPEPTVFEIPLNSEITHGPYLGESGFGLAKIVTRPDLSGLDFPDELKASLGADTIVIEDVVDFSRQLNETVTVAPIKVTTKDATVIDFAGAKVISESSADNRYTFTADAMIEKLTVSNDDEPELFIMNPFKMDIQGKGEPDMSKGTYEATSGEMSFEMGESGKLVAQALALKGNYTQAEGIEMMLGGGELSLRDIEITNPDALPAPIKIPEFMVKSLVEQNKSGDMDISASYAATLDSSLMTVMNSPVDVKTVQLDVVIKSLPVAVVTKYQEMMQSIAAGESEPGAEAMQEELTAIIQSIVKSASSMTMNLAAKATEGDLNADVELGFQPGLELSEDELMELMGQADPGSLLSILVGRGHVDLSKGITDKAGMTPMVSMMAGDFVKLDGETFKSDMRITDGQLYVNDQLVPLAPAAARQSDEVLTDEMAEQIAKDAAKSLEEADEAMKVTE